MVRLSAVTPCSVASVSGYFCKNLCKSWRCCQVEFQILQSVKCAPYEVVHFRCPFFALAMCPSAGHWKIIRWNSSFGGRKLSRSLWSPYVGYCHLLHLPLHKRQMKFSTSALYLCCNRGRWYPHAKEAPRLEFDVDPWLWNVHFKATANQK
jgi:hypothetical protein